MFNWFRNRESKRRRESYQAIKELITKSHLAGNSQVAIDPKKHAVGDLESFKSPMYRVVIQWRADLMNEEIGTPGPLAVSSSVVPPDEES